MIMIMVVLCQKPITICMCMHDRINNRMERSSTAIVQKIAQFPTDSTFKTRKPQFAATDHILQQGAETHLRFFDDLHGLLRVSDAGLHLIVAGQQLRQLPPDALQKLVHGGRLTDQWMVTISETPSQCQSQKHPAYLALRDALLMITSETPS